MLRINLQLLGIALVAAISSAAVHAQTGYPSKPVTLMVAFAAGGDSDLSGRNLAQHAQKYLNNQPLVVVNRVGAAGQDGLVATRTEVTERRVEVMQKLAVDPDWLAGKVKLAGIPAIRSAAETEQFMREQYELYEKIAISLGVRQ